MSIGRRRFLQIGAASAATSAGACTPAPLVCKAREPSGTGRAFGGKIEHFVVLMLENRSYDLMLGALRGPEYDGIADDTPLAYQDRNGSPATVHLRHGEPADHFSPDPGHSFKAVAAQIRGGQGRAADMG